MLPKINNKILKGNFTHVYTVAFEVSPSNGTFENRLLYDQATNIFRLHDDILRINFYGQTSACIKDEYTLRSFCYCISYQEQSRNVTSTNNTNVSNTTLIYSTMMGQ